MKRHGREFSNQLQELYTRWAEHRLDCEICGRPDEVCRAWRPILAELGLADPAPRDHPHLTIVD